MVLWSYQSVNEVDPRYLLGRIKDQDLRLSAEDIDGATNSELRWRLARWIQSASTTINQARIDELPKDRHLSTASTLLLAPYDPTDLSAYEVGWMLYIGSGTARRLATVTTAIDGTKTIYGAANAQAGDPVHRVLFDPSVSVPVRNWIRNHLTDASPLLSEDDIALIRGLPGGGDDALPAPTAQTLPEPGASSFTDLDDTPSSLTPDGRRLETAQGRVVLAERYPDGSIPPNALQADTSDDRKAFRDRIGAAAPGEGGQGGGGVSEARVQQLIRSDPSVVGLGEFEDALRDDSPVAENASVAVAVDQAAYRLQGNPSWPTPEPDREIDLSVANPPAEHRVDLSAIYAKPTASQGTTLSTSNAVVFADQNGDNYYFARESNGTILFSADNTGGYSVTVIDDAIRIFASALPPATQSEQGAMSAGDKTKLDGIAAGAGVPRTDSEIDGRISNYGRPFTSTDETKLDGIEANAKDDQTGVEIRNLLQALSGNARLAASAVQGLRTDAQVNALANARIAALRPNAFTDADETKLDGIEAGAKDDLTGPEIVALLQALAGAARLDASAIKNLPSGGGSTTPVAPREIAVPLSVAQRANAASGEVTCSMGSITATEGTTFGSVSSDQLTLADAGVYDIYFETEITNSVGGGGTRPTPRIELQRQRSGETAWASVLVNERYAKNPNQGRSPIVQDASRRLVVRANDRFRVRWNAYRQPDGGGGNESLAGTLTVLREF